MQANRKTREGSSHPDRDAQFGYINQQTILALEEGRPVVSVDTKKKELVGEFKNSGQEWQPRGQPLTVRVHDFPDPRRGKAVPYGVYDLANNEGWVSVGTNHDTAEFAAASIGRWWRQMGRGRFPKAKRLLITADGGGSDSSRSRLPPGDTWPTNCIWSCRCAIFRRAPASGTRSSIGCSASSLKTGADDRCSATKRSST